MSNIPAISALVFFPAMMVYAGLGDLKTMKIPNRLVLLLFGGYVVLAPLSGMELREIALSAAAAGLVFALAFLAFVFRQMGGGDVKLMAVAALWLGASSAAPFVVYTALLGSVLTILFLLFRAMDLPSSLRRCEWLQRLHGRQSGIPYGVAIAAAAIVLFSRTHWASTFA